MIEPLYGFPCVENPHDFTPDMECCTPNEIAFWEDAKKRWDSGERDVRGLRCCSTVSRAAKSPLWRVGTEFELELLDRLGLSEPAYLERNAHPPTSQAKAVRGWCYR